MKKRKNIALLVAPIVLTGGLVVGTLSYGIYKNIQTKMQERQDGIIEAINQNPLTRVSSEEEFRELYKKVQENYDAGYERYSTK